MAKATNFHQLSALDINKKEVKFSSLSGKVVLVVNVASAWGLTAANYKEFATLLSKHKKDGLEIVAFPCNQFGAQEPGSNEEIKKFAAGKGFTGLLMDKINVNDPNTHPVYAFLKEASGDTSPISWNFAKFLVAKDGSVKGRFSPQTGPMSLEPQIAGLLASK